jgi:diaminopimelate epimerase
VIFQDPGDERAEMDLARIARAFQSDRERFPQGTNVNFMKIRTTGEIDLRTYERGVNDFTMSCGTGSTAGAVAAWLEGKVSTPVEVRNPGGVNTVLIDEEGPGRVRLFLTGQTTAVAEGVVSGECLQIRKP